MAGSIAGDDIHPKPREGKDTQCAACLDERRETSIRSYWNPAWASGRSPGGMAARRIARPLVSSPLVSSLVASRLCPLVSYPAIPENSCSFVVLLFSR